jgi:hypothetical protein
MSFRTASFITASVTRPNDTTAYAAGDLVANSTTAGSVTPLSFSVARAAVLPAVTAVRLRKTGTSITNAVFRLHLFSSSPTVANGDNGAFSASGQAGYLGAVDVVMSQVFTDGAFGEGVPVFEELPFAMTANPTTLYGLIEVRQAYTPIAVEVFTPELGIGPA